MEVLYEPTPDDDGQATFTRDHDLNNLMIDAWEPGLDGLRLRKVDADGQSEDMGEWSSAYEPNESTFLRDADGDIFEVRVRQNGSAERVRTGHPYLPAVRVLINGSAEVEDVERFLEKILDNLAEIRIFGMADLQREFDGWRAFHDERRKEARELVEKLQSGECKLPNRWLAYPHDPREKDFAVLESNLHRLVNHAIQRDTNTRSMKPLELAECCERIAQAIRLRTQEPASEDKLL